MRVCLNWLIAPKTVNSNDSAMRFLKTMIVVVALAAFGADDPFTGLWKLNLEKSKLPLPVPRNETVRIEADTENIRIVQEGVNDKGEPFKLTVSGGFDGKYYGVLDSPSVDTVWFRRLDSHTIFAKAMKSGTEIEAGTAVVAKNGKTVKISISITETNGKEIRAIAVLDKQ
jgi:hypothetical protein